MPWHHPLSPLGTAQPEPVRTGGGPIGRHGSLLIGPDVGTVPRPAAGPSQGQHPQGAVDEQGVRYPRSLGHSNGKVWVRPDAGPYLGRGQEQRRVG
jgi:hypothetical protein